MSKGRDVATRVNCVKHHLKNSQNSACGIKTGFMNFFKTSFFVHFLVKNYCAIFNYFLFFFLRYFVQKKWFDLNFRAKIYKSNRIVYCPKANNIDKNIQKIGDLGFTTPEDERPLRLNRNFSADEASIWVKL